MQITIETLSNSGYSSDLTIQELSDLNEHCVSIMKSENKTFAQALSEACDDCGIYLIDTKEVNEFDEHAKDMEEDFYLNHVKQY